VTAVAAALRLSDDVCPDEVGTLCPHPGVSPLWPSPILPSPSPIFPPPSPIFPSPSPIFPSPSPIPY
jgi:hypothetical protein